MQCPLTCLLLLLGLLLTGCSRSPDLLDRRIEGRHLDDLQVSVDRIVAASPTELAREFVFCFSNIKAEVLMDRSGTHQNQEDRVCRRLRDKSVREVLIEGNELANRAIAARLAEQSNYLLRVLNQSEQYTAAQQQGLPARIQRLQAVIAELNETLAKSDRRLAELRAPSEFRVAKQAP